MNGGESRWTKRARGQAGFLMTDLVIAMAILVIAMIPLGYSVWREQRLLEDYYFRSVAMTIVDGEFEVLAAGAWQTIEQGTHPYPVRATAASNLPPGEFLVTREEDWLRLEWRPAGTNRGSRVVRETTMP
jgi:hypothetical protein